MKSLNRVQLIGNVGKEPEVKYTGSGKAVAKLSVATNESYKDTDGEWQEKTEWHNIVAWEKLAEIVGQYVKKGDKIFIEGRSTTRSWDDKTSGEKKYITEVVAKDLIMLGAKDSTGTTPAAAVPARRPITDDDIPF